jgi:putative transcription antitermination factor YqgF
MEPPEFEASPSLLRGRVAGIDYGRRRIGVAVCDAERIIASPLCVRETTGDHAADAAFFQALAREEELGGFVVGLPLHADGTGSSMSNEAKRFGAWLGRATGLPVVFQDERYTSHEAAGMLGGVGLSRGAKKSMSDAVAAQVILRSWMDASKAAAAAPRPVRLVVGCGYLGERVARRFLARGDRVVGTTRSSTRAERLEAAGIQPALIDVTAADPGWPELLAANPPTSILWCVSVDRSAAKSYHEVQVGGLAKLLDSLRASNAVHPRVVFASSTGVWGDEQGGTVTEATPATPSREAGRVLLEAERVLAEHPAGPGTSLRFAGLYGPDRLPRLADLRAARPIAADPDSWLNLIHIDDAAAVVVAASDAVSPKLLYVVSDGRPVLRRDWYGRVAELAGAPSPTWDVSAPRSRGGDKRVDPSLVQADLGIEFSYPDALAAIPGILDGQATK